ncbi:hypothetical protein QTN25_002597 [Entamoeba marina]
MSSTKHSNAFTDLSSLIGYVPTEKIMPITNPPPLPPLYSLPLKSYPLFKRPFFPPLKHTLTQQLSKLFNVPNDFVLAKKNCGLLLLNETNQLLSNPSTLHDYNAVVLCYRSYQLASFFLDNDVGCLANAQHALSIASSANKQLSSRLLLGSALLYDAADINSSKLFQLNSAVTLGNFPEGKLPKPLILVKSCNISSRDPFTSFPSEQSQLLMKKCNATRTRIQSECSDLIKRKHDEIAMFTTTSNIVKWHEYAKESGIYESSEIVQRLPIAGEIAVSLGNAQQLIRTLPPQIASPITSKYNSYVSRWMHISEMVKRYNNKERYKVPQEMLAKFENTNVIEKIEKELKDSLEEFDKDFDENFEEGDFEEFVATAMSNYHEKAQLISVKLDEINDLLLEVIDVVKVLASNSEATNQWLGFIKAAPSLPSEIDALSKDSKDLVRQITSMQQNFLQQQVITQSHYTTTPQQHPYYNQSMITSTPLRDQQQYYPQQNSNSIYGQNVPVYNQNPPVYNQNYPTTSTQKTLPPLPPSSYGTFQNNNQMLESTPIPRYNQTQLPRQQFAQPIPQQNSMIQSQYYPGRKY